MNKKELELEIENLLLENGYELVELNVKNGQNPILEVYIYKKDGIGIDDCKLVSDLIDNNIDTDSYFPNNYNLEVASPGLDRNLKTDGDLRRNINKTLEIKLYQKVNDKKELVADLIDFNETTIKVKNNDEILEINRDIIATMKQYIDFGRI